MPFTDYFKVLGIPITATDAEIKDAYKKLSKKFHPDLNNGDKYFEERFKEIQEAYEVLSNPTRKARYLEDYHKFYNGNKKEEPVISPNPSPQTLKPKSYSWATWLLGFIAIMIIGTAIRVGSHEVIEDRKRQEAESVYNNSTIKNSPVVEPAQPAQEATPVPVPEPEPPVIEDDPCIFGVVYYSYYSASEGKTHNDLTPSETLPDTLSRKQQEQLLFDLSKNCGPVGANVYVTEKKIFYARNRETARNMKFYLLEELIKREYPVQPKY